MKAATLEAGAFCLMLGLGACADSLGSSPGGMVVLLGGVGLSGLLVHAAQSGCLDREREPQKSQMNPGTGQTLPPHFPRRNPTRYEKSRWSAANTPTAKRETQPLN